MRQDDLKRTRRANLTVGALLTVLMCALGSLRAQDGQEIESLLSRGIPSESDPSALVKAHRDSRVLPFKPVDQIPLYGLPHGFVQTSTGRLALRIDDLSLPGKVPIQMGYVYDSGVSAPKPVSLTSLTEPERLTEDLGSGWILGYSDYISPTNGGFVLQASDGSSIAWVPDQVGPSYHKDPEFPSDHLALTIIDANTLEEERADRTKWRYSLDSGSGNYHLSTVTDRHGNTLTLGYESGILKHIQNSEGYWVEIHRPVFDATNPSFPHSRITSIVDSAGRSAVFDYSASGYLTTWTDPNGRVWHFSYESNRKLQQVTNPENQVALAADYNEDHRITALALGSGATTFEYTSGTTNVTDPRSNATNYAYNGNGISTSVTTPDGSTAIELDSNNNVKRFYSAGGAAYDFTWDGHHRLLSYTAPSPEVEPLTWTYAYDDKGRVRCASNPKATRTLYWYNEHSDITTQVTGASSGNCTGYSAPTSAETCESDPTKRCWTAAYDASGNLTSLTNPRGFTTGYGYNAHNLRTSIVLPAGTSSPHVTDLAYDTAGRLMTISRPLTVTTKATWQVQYDARGGVISITDPTQRVMSYQYDNAGRIRESSNGVGVMHVYHYDAASRLVEDFDSNGTSHTAYAYDGADNLTVLTDAMGNAWSYTYDGMNRLASKEDPLGRTNTYLYTPEGNLQEQQFPSNEVIRYTYDQQNRLLKRSYPDGSYDVLDYDRNGFVTGIEKHLGWESLERVEYTYTGFDQVSDVSIVVTGEKNFETALHYEYDENGNRVRAQNGKENLVTYTYDSLDRLTHVYTEDSRGETTMQYDPWSLQRNFLSMSRTGEQVRYGFDTAGRVSYFQRMEGVFPGGLHDVNDYIERRTFSRDAAGLISTILVEVPPNEDSPGNANYTMAFTRDNAGRVLSKTNGDGTRDDYQYDALGRVVLLARTGGGTAHLYEAGFNAAGEPTYVSDGDHLYNYEYTNSSDLQFSLEVTKSGVFQGDGSQKTRFDYDGRVREVLQRANASEYAIAETFGWLPRGFDQVIKHWWAKDDTIKFYLPDLATSWGTYAPSDGSKLLFPADYGVEALASLGLGETTAARTSESREEFRYFARSIPANVKGSMSTGIPLVYGTPRTDTFTSEEGLTRVLERSKEAPPYFQGLDDLKDIPEASYFDATLGSDLYLGGDPSAYNDNDSDRGPHTAVPRSDVEMQRRKRPIIGCLFGGCNDPHPGVPIPPEVNADLGDDDEGGRVPPSQCGNECRWNTTPASCPLGFDSFFRNTDDQEPYRNAADDPYGVTLSNGEFIFGVEDLSLPGIGPSLTLIRTYRSRVRMETAMGYGWFHNYQERLSTLDQTCTHLSWIRGDMMAVDFTWDGVGNYVPAPGTYLTLKPDGSGFRMRFLDGTIHYFDSMGRLTRIEDRFGNSLRLDYINDGDASHSRDVSHVKEFDAAGTDTGRFFLFHYGEVCDSSGGGANGPPEEDPTLFARVCKWRLKDVTDSAGRQVVYTYSGDADIEPTIATRMEIEAGRIGNLRVVTAPVTTSAKSPLGDVSSRRRTEYQYSFNPYASSIDPLQHNLREIHKPIAPDLLDADSLQGAAFLRVYYEADGTGDRVGSIAFGQQPTNPVAFFTGGTCTGGTCIHYQYEEANWPASNAITKTTVTDRRGNKIEYEISQGAWVAKKTILFPTSGGTPIKDNTACSCGGSAPARSDRGWETCYGYDGLGQLEWEIQPSGSRLDQTYNDKGLIVQRVDRPASLLSDGAQGPERNCADQVSAGAHRTFTYEPLYSQVDSSTTPRVNVTSYIYDYEEAPAPSPQAPIVGFRKYLSDWDIEVSTVAPYMNKQDQNGDGTGSWKGSVVKMREPVVIDAAGHPHHYSMRYHPLSTGQLERLEGPLTEVAGEPFESGQDVRMAYYPSNSAGGVGGYLHTRTAMVDQSTQPEGFCGANTSYSQITTSYQYDAYGNVSDVVDPRQVRTSYLYNELNQLKQVTRAATAPAGLTAYSYKTKYKHDAAGNVIEQQVQSNSPGEAEDYSVRHWTYDILNRRRTESVDLSSTASLVSRFCYDQNENPIRTVSPAGRVTTATYDVRNMPTSTSRYITTITNDTNACSATLTTTTPDGDATATSTVSYDSAGNAIDVTDPLGHKGSQEFDGFNRLIEVSVDVDDTQDHKMQTEFERDQEGNITAAMSRGSKDGSSYPAPLPVLERTETEYDELGRVRRSWRLYERDPELDSCTTHTCTPNANQGAFESSFLYDGSGRVMSVKSPEGRTTAIEYDQLGRPWKSVDAAGDQKIDCYDPNGNVVMSASTEVSGLSGLPANVPNKTLTSAQHWDSLGLLDVRTVDPGGLPGLITTFAYDARGLLVSMTDPEQHIARRTYDKAGRLFTTTTPSSASAAYNPDGMITTRLDYDDDSNIKTLTGDLTADTGIQYFVDGMNRPFAIKYPDGSGKVSTLDAGGRAVEVRLQSSVGNVATNPTNCGDSSIDCIRITNNFDNVGRLLNRYVDLTNANRHHIVNGIEIWNFEGTGEQHPIDSYPTHGIPWHQTYRYDGLSRLLVGDDQNRNNEGQDDSEIVRSYDTLSRLISDGQRVQSGNTPIIKTVESSYDKDSIRNEVKYVADGGTQQRAYSLVRDVLGRIQSISQGAGSVANYSYLGPAVLERKLGGTAAPAVTLKRYASGQDFFDGAGRPTEIQYERAGTPWIDHVYGYDLDSRRKYEVHLDEASGSDYRGNLWTYDGSDRLLTGENRTVTETGAIIGDPQAHDISDLYREYVHDGEGNWLEHHEKNPGSNTTSNYAQLLEPPGAEGYGMNQYASWKGPTSTPANGSDIKYDWLGNVSIATLTLGGVQKTLHFYYDFAGRLVRIKFPDSTDVSYAYDVLKRRISKRSTGTPQLYIYDGWRAVEDYSGTDQTPVRRYVWGNGPDELLMMEDSNQSKYYFAEDYLGSIVGVGNASGTSIVKYDYGPFGDLISECPPGSTAPCTPTNFSSQFQFRYTGQRYDAESGLYYYKNRYYSPELGRFLSRDPVGTPDGPNRYAYVNNMPTMASDPSGLLLREWRADTNMWGIIMAGHKPRGDGPMAYQAAGGAALKQIEKPIGVTESETGSTAFAYNVEQEPCTGDTEADWIKTLLNNTDEAVLVKPNPDKTNSNSATDDLAMDIRSSSQPDTYYQEQPIPERWTKLSVPYRNVDQHLKQHNHSVNSGGLIASVGAEAGVVAVGAGVEGSAAVGVFGGEKNPTVLGWMLTGGAFAGGPGWGVSKPDNGKGGTVGSLFAGAGVGGWISNATTIEEPRDSFHMIHFNLGVGPIKASIEYSWLGETEILSVTVGPGFPVSGGGFDTFTKTGLIW